MTQLEVESGDMATQGKTPLDIQQVDNQLDTTEEVDSDEEINGEDGESLGNGETTTSDGSNKESDNKDTRQMATWSQLLRRNITKQTTQRQNKSSTTDILKPETNQDPSHEEITPEVPNAQRNNGVSRRGN